MFQFFYVCLSKISAKCDAACQTRLLSLKQDSKLWCDEKEWDFSFPCNTIPRKICKKNKIHIFLKFIVKQLNPEFVADDKKRQLPGFSFQ